MRRTFQAALPTVSLQLLVAAALPGCDLGDLLGGGQLTDDEAAVRAMNADVQPRQIVEEHVLGCVVAAGVAANLTGADDFVTTGTVDLHGAEPTYSASPDDELVVREQGHDTRYRIESIAISEVASIAEILLHDHEVRARAIRDDTFDLDLASVRANDELDRTAAGTFVADGFTFELELEDSGSSATEINGDIVRYDSTKHTTSLVTGEDLDIEVDEDEDYLLIISDSAFENRTTVTSLDATIEGKVVRMDQGRVRRSFENAAPAEPDFWAETDGELELNGEVIGALAFAQGDGGAYQVVLELQGDDEVLESWTP